MNTHWVYGKSTPGKGATIDVLNPATEELLDRIPAGSAEDTAAAVAAAKRAAPAWAALSPVERRNAIRISIDKLIAAREEIARLLTMEMGKPFRFAVAEVNSAIDAMRGFSELSVNLRSGNQMAAALELNFQQRIPRGVVACIVPWNFPIVVGLENSVPNLLVGNTVIWKPSEKTPLTSRLIVERIFDHLPPGVINLVLGDGLNAGEPLVTSPDVDMIIFVGSERTGRRIGQHAGGALKKVILELGGKDPMIVDETVNIRAAAKLAAEASYFNTGQICTSTERIYVAKKIFNEFVDTLVEESKAYKIGNGLEDGVDLGPLVDDLQLNIVSDHVTDAVKRGARALCGGERLGNKGYFYPPTVLVDVPADSKVMTDETFGPVAPCIPFDDFDEALALANAGPFGLAGIVCTTSSARAIHAIHNLQVGMLKVNTMRGKAHGGTSEPFKASGLGHGYGLEFLMEITKQKSVYWRGEPKL